MREKQTNLKSNKAMTLIALVVTIIVLLILVGVTISMVTGDNGLLEKSEQEVFLYEIGQYNEELAISIADDSIGKKGVRNTKFNVKRSSYDDEDSFFNAMKTKIPSFNKKFVNKLEIIEDELIYVGEDTKEREWIDNILKVGSMLTINYLYEDGTAVCNPYKNVISDGNFEVQSPEIEGYVPNESVVAGTITSNINITVTYYGESEGLEYQLLSDGTYAISGAGTFNSQYLIIPKKYNGQPVTKINNNVFANKTMIKNVIIPNTLKEIGTDTFKYCTGINKIIMGDNVEKINRAAFCYCIGLKEIKLNDKIDKIEEQVFYDCSGLEKITIGKSINSIKRNAFEGCTKWTQTVLSPENTSYHLIDNVLYSLDDKSILGVPTGTVGKFSVNDNVTSIGYGAFAFCTKLTEIDLGSNTLTLGGTCFQGCTGLSFMNIGNKVTTIGTDCFKECKNITEITIDDSVNTLGQAAFCYCTKLNKIEIGKNVSSLGILMFYSDGKLKNIIYNGTIDQWNSISKPSGWREEASVTQIICTDGTIDL